MDRLKRFVLLISFTLSYVNISWSQLMAALPSSEVSSLAETSLRNIRIPRVEELLNDIQSLDLSAPINEDSAIGQVLKVDFLTDTFPSLCIHIDNIREQFLQRFDFSTHTLKAHDDIICVIKVLDGETILTGSGDCTLKLWKYVSDSWNCVQIFQGHTNEVRSAIQLNDSLIVSSGGFSDQSIRLWDISSGTCVCVIKSSDSIYSLTKINDHMFVSSGACTSSVWNVDHKLGDINCSEIISLINMNEIITIKNGTMIGISCLNGSKMCSPRIDSFELETRQTQTLLPKIAVGSTIIGPTPVKLGELVVYNLAGNIRAGFALNSTTLAMVSEVEDDVIIFDENTASCYAMSPKEHGNAYAIEKINDFMLATGTSQGIRIWDTQSKACKITFITNKWPFAIAHFKKNFIIGSGGREKGEIKFWDLRLIDYSVPQLILFLGMKLTRIQPDQLHQDWRGVYDSLPQ